MMLNDKDNDELIQMVQALMLDNKVFKDKLNEYENSGLVQAKSWSSRSTSVHQIHLCWMVQSMNSLDR